MMYAVRQISFPALVADTLVGQVVIIVNTTDCIEASGSVITYD